MNLSPATRFSSGLVVCLLLLSLAVVGGTSSAQAQDRAPVVLAPATAFGTEGTLISFTVSASDPDGDALTSLTAAPLPAGATFNANAAFTSGTFSWTPTFTQSGTYSVTFSASNALTGSATTAISVSHGDRPPVVTAPAVVSGSENSLIIFTVTASSPDGFAITSFTAAPLQPGATFTTNASKTSGTFSWTPTLSQAGTYSVTFTACNFLCGAATTIITVTNRDETPVAEAGGPYSGVVGVPVAFDGTGSFDPNGDALTYTWEFGDGGTAIGPTPLHVYAASGSYLATLTVSDGVLSASDAASVSIVDFFSTSIFTKNRYRRIRLGGGSSNKSWCAQVEPQGGTYAIENVDPSSIRLSYGTGQIASVSAKHNVSSDLNGNGVPDFEVCFALSDLQTLGFPTGTSVVTMTISGNLITGGSFRGDLTIEVINGSGGVAARITPNPLNPDAVLSFQTGRSGSLRVQIFDPSGRLVRTVLDEAISAPGRHEMRIDGRDADGVPLASGIYFYRILSSDGPREGRFTILK
jgi:hypothetical protein